MSNVANVPATLALADGRVFKGLSFGSKRGIDNPIKGEVVFNTSMMGYQEILTDPSYSRQIMCFTCPHIGNVGCNEEDNESEKVHVEGMLIRNLSRITSNFRCEKSLGQYLEDAGIMGMHKIDTREIVTHVRDTGAQMGVLACGEKLNPDDLVDLAKQEKSMDGAELVQHVTCKEPYDWNQSSWKLERGFSLIKPEDSFKRPHVVAIDCGVKYNILRRLVDVGFRVTVVPANSTSEEILALKPDGLFISNGPGDPAPLEYVVSSVKDLLGKIPMFGICLGHQILAQAFGGKTYKLKFGHRGGNHPVMDMTTGKVEITVQNHGFAVDGETLSTDIEVTHINLNDQTVEGLTSPKHRAFCVQYHPEASPGPHDAKYLFERFYNLVVDGSWT